jgi:GR25 family glycosyltransferase involved in LPS biosynthesis
MLFTEIPVIYINLDSRPDRNDHVKNELAKVGINNPERFKAIKLENGALGCSMSHLKCIENAKQKDYPCVFICEDDIEFLDPSLFLNQMQTFLNSNINWDVIIVAGNNMLPYTPVNNTCIKVLNCQTTTGYIVKKEYYDKLMQNYKEGIQKLMKEPTNNEYKIDKYWFRLQREHNWYLIIPLTVVQKEDYSDIEKRVTNFKNYMLNYNKAYKK